MQLIEIETPSLVLRPAVHDEVVAYGKLYEDDNFRRYLTPYNAQKAQQELLEYFDKNAKQIQAQPNYFLLIADKAQQHPVGLMHMWGQNSAEISIGGGIAPVYQNKGYRTEAITATKNFLHQEMGVFCVSARVLAANAASCRVLEKSGFMPTNKEYISWESFIPNTLALSYIAYRPDPDHWLPG